MDVIRVKRAYEPPAPGDGFRVLVDRLWPRGVTKEKARLDQWARDVAPSPALRTWFGHDPERFAEFSARYRGELARSPGREIVAELARRAARGTVTLVYGARDERHNGARVLAEEIEAAHGARAPS